MTTRRFIAIALAAAGILLIAFSYSAASAGTPQQDVFPSVLSGVVVNADGPVPGALVQVQGTPNTTQADQHGAFTLEGVEGPAPVVLTAWSSGHYVGWVALDPAADDWPGADQITITMRALPTRGDAVVVTWMAGAISIATLLPATPGITARRVPFTARVRMTAASC